MFRKIEWDFVKDEQKMIGQGKDMEAEKKYRA